MELLKVEFLKIKKSSLLFTALAVPIAIVLIFIKKAQSLTVNGLEINEAIIMFSSITFIALVLPLLNTFTACIITKVENDNNGWKQLMLMPIKKSNIYFTKYKIMLLTLAASIVSYLLAVILGGFFISKKIDLSLFVLGIEIFITSLPVIIILFIIGRNFTSIIPVISAGVIMMITNIFIAQSRFWIYAPWTYALSITNGSISSYEKYIAIGASLVLAFLLFALDYISFKKSDIM